MCGISCILSEKDIKEKELHEYNNAVIHRGPDSQNLELLKCGNFNVGLGHTRLSIIDLNDQANQPFTFLDKYKIIFNGEIYNYLEIRTFLINQGIKFLTNSDTEVLLASYYYWGEDMLNQLKGMFSFIIIDCDKNQLFAARDRFGIKPLYYLLQNNTLYFCSEIKQLMKLKAFEAKLNFSVAKSYLTNGITDQNNNTFFNNVYQFSPGTFIKIDLQSSLENLKIKKWYVPSKVYKEKKKLSILFSSSITKHLRSDVDIGSCLSGGIDSSAVVCNISQQKTSQQHTFSALSDNKNISEKKWIQIVCDSKNLKNYTVTPNFEDMLNNIEDFVYKYDEPFGSTSILAQYEVFKLAKSKGIKVMLDGQGADELFGGYHSFLGLRYLGLLKKFKFLSFFKELKVAKKDLGISYIRSIFQILNFVFPRGFSEKFYFLMGKSTSSAKFLGKLFLKRKIKIDNLDHSKVHDLNEFSKELTFKYHLPMLLKWEDRSSMSHSVEARVPFLDHEIYEFSQSLSDSDKISLGITKKILRESQEGIVPLKILERKDKIGFATDEAEWLKSNESNIIKLIEKYRYDDLFDYEYIRKNYNKLVKGHTIWRILNLLIWIKVFKVKVYD